MKLHAILALVGSKVNMSMLMLTSEKQTVSFSNCSVLQVCLGGLCI